MNSSSKAIWVMTATALVVSGSLLARSASAGDQGQLSAVLLDVQERRVGVVQFEQAQTRVSISVVLDGTRSINAGFHGIHVHANDRPDTGQGCVADVKAPPATWFASADGHYSRADETHGRHRGDMPSLLVGRDGDGQLQFTAAGVRLRDLVGKAVILHAGPDNFGNVPIGRGPDRYTPNSDDAAAATAKSGNAGDRIACGVIVSA
jgi:superoxide dismutase, Cu-Zn family